MPIKESICAFKASEKKFQGVVFDEARQDVLRNQPCPQEFAVCLVQDLSDQGYDATHIFPGREHQHQHCRRGLVSICTSLAMQANRFRPVEHGSVSSYEQKRTNL